MVPTLETARLILRPIRRDDAPRIQSVFPDIEITRYLAGTIPWPYPENGAETFVDTVLAANETGKRFVWAITLRGGDDILVGIIEVGTEGTENRGFWLMPQYHRMGFMTEAVAAVNDFAFDTLGMAQIQVSNAVPNTGSSRLKTKSGATLVEVKPEVSYVGGTFPTEVWILTAEQWRENRIRFLSSGAS